MRFSASEHTIMPVMVKKLYKNGQFLYEMCIVAGHKGLSNLVQWVHIIEDDHVSSFLHGNELVFTAGILNTRPDWMLEFAQKLHGAGASAFVVNIGPYTKEIPNDVMEYCNEVAMPLFTIPWKTRMVDMTRDFCHRIMRNEQVESTVVSTLKNIIFNIGDLDTQVLQMERYGYQRNAQYCFIAIDKKGGEDPEDEEDEMLLMIAERAAKNISELFVSFLYKEFRILVLVNYTDEEVRRFIDDYLSMAGQRFEGLTLHVGVSANQAGIYNQNANFKKALSAMEMARTRLQTLAYYDQLGIYKILYAVEDKEILRSFYNETIGQIEKYDTENKTQLFLLLKEYLDSNGSLQAVSEKQFIHRNTVTNQLKKIESLTGYSPLELEDKVFLSMGMYIRNIL